MTIGKEGLKKTWQAEFPETVECVHCQGEARIGFVAHEGLSGVKTPEEGDLCTDANGQQLLCHMHKNDPDGKGYWLHDCCAVAVYFCTKCLNTTAEYNQG